MLRDETEALRRIRLVAVDLDGTLLNSKGGPSWHTRTVVRKASKYGVSVAIASGRSSFNTSRIAWWVGARGPQIAVNGAHVLSPNARHDWQFIPMQADALKTLLSMLRRIGATFEATLRGRVAVERPLVPGRRARPPGLRVLSGFLGLTVAAPVTVLPEGAVDDLAGEVAKIYTDAPPDKVKVVMEAVERDFGGVLRSVITRTHAGETLLEIMDASVNKGQALLMAGERLGLAREEIAAIGDGNNDVEMIEAAGVGVAMANAAPRLAHAADCFTLSCDDDGVAHFLEQVYRAKG